MFRKLAVATALLVVTSPRLFALGLGEINMQSALNQPMRAAIELTSSAGTPVESIKVALASLEAHQRAGLTKSSVLANFRFAVEKGSSGNAVVRVTSTDAVREPYLEFLLELEWPNGRLLRQYTVLVDPPVTMPATPVAPAAPVTRAASRVTTPEPERTVSAPVVQPAPVTQATTARAPADEYGPIRRDETLWSIAERVRPDEGVSMHQMMLALQRANPDAFVNGNMNLLKAGSTLKVPGREDILAVSTREAIAETRRQYSEWQSMTAGAAEAADKPVPGPYAETETETAVPVAPAAPAGSSAGARLQLVAPEGDAVEGAASPGDPETATGEAGGTMNVNQQLALATEEAEASKAESAELKSRVSELETQIETMKRLLELKDDALANLQNGVAADAETGIDAGTDAAAEVASADTPEATAPASEPEASAASETLEPETMAAPPVAKVEAPASREPEGLVAGVMRKVMENPLLAGVGALALLLLGGFLWFANRRNAEPDPFAEDMTLANRLAGQEGRSGREWPQPVFDVADEEVAEAPEEEHVAHDSAASDPVAEAEVYLAYGRIQQAEDVLQAALQRAPDSDDIRLKLLEVYHIAGNTAAFEQAASDFRDGVAEDDSRWIRVATLGYAMAPQNPLYRAGAPADTGESGAEMAVPDPVDDNSIDFDLDLSGADSHIAATADDELGLDLEPPSPQTVEQPIGIEFGLDELEEEDGYDGLLASEDEVTTKLDLARAYIDMDDKDSARSILGEVMEEGNAAQKQEAEKIFAQIA